MAQDAMTSAEKDEAIQHAWAEYRSASQAIPRMLPFAGYMRGGVYREGFLEIDERLWKRYLATERAVLAAPEKKAA